MIEVASSLDVVGLMRVHDLELDVTDAAVDERLIGLLDGQGDHVRAMLE